MSSPSSSLSRRPLQTTTTQHISHRPIKHNAHHLLTSRPTYSTDNHVTLIHTHSIRSPLLLHYNTSLDSNPINTFQLPPLEHTPFRTVPVSTLCHTHLSSSFLLRQIHANNHLVSLSPKSSSRRSSCSSRRPSFCRLYNKHTNQHVSPIIPRSPARLILSRCLRAASPRRLNNNTPQL